MKVSALTIAPSVEEFAFFAALDSTGPRALTACGADDRPIRADW